MSIFSLFLFILLHMSKVEFIVHTSSKTSELLWKKIDDTGPMVVKF